jgi:branched-chain amino acid transport system permease protein
LGFAETVRIIASNEIWLTNGTDGLSGIPGPWRADLAPYQFNLLYLCLVSVIVMLGFAAAERLGHSPFGRVLRAIREDEQVAAVAGKPVLAFKVRAFALGSFALGLAGALYGHYTSYIAPDIFVPLLTLYIKLALLAGGLGNNLGAVLGAFLVVFFLESTRFIVPLVPGLTHVQGAALREFLISASLIVILRFRAQGLVPEAREHPVVTERKGEALPLA